MATFPTSIPAAGTASASSTLAAAGHTSLHNTDRNEIRALATKVGITSSADTASHDYKLSGVADKAVSLSGVETLANKTINSPVINDATINGADMTETTVDVPILTGGGSWSGSPTLTTPTLNSPTISNFTSAQHDHGDTDDGGQIVAGAIPADLITAAMMQHGIVKNRQGDTTGDATWNDAGTNNTDTSGKAVFIQCGAVQGSTGGDVTVTFPTAFTQVPIVVATQSTANGSNSYPVIVTKGATQFTFRLHNAVTNLTTNEQMNWIAIGQ